MIQKLALLGGLLPDPRPGMSFESGYFQALEWRQGHGTERQVDRGIGNSKHHQRSVPVRIRARDACRLGFPRHR